MNSVCKKLFRPGNIFMASALALAALSALMPELTWAQTGKSKLMEVGEEVGESTLEVAMVWIRNASVLGVIATAIGAGFNMVDKKPAVRWICVLVIIAVSAQVVDFFLSFRTT